MSAAAMCISALSAGARAKAAALRNMNRIKTKAAPMHIPASAPFCLCNYRFTFTLTGLPVSMDSLQASVNSTDFTASS